MNDCQNNKSFYRDINVFVLQEMKENGFNRFDVIVRLLAIENYYNKNNYGFQLYERMQRKRFEQKPFIREAKEKNCCRKFCGLIRSVENRGYINNENPLILNDQSHLINGSHRLSLCFYHKIDLIKCIYSENENDFHQHIQYDLFWFENCFTSVECLIIKQRMLNLIEDIGLLTYAIIWPAAYSFVNKIEDMILQFFDIISYYDIEFKDEISLENFIELVYSNDTYRADRKNDKILNSKKNLETQSVRIYQLKYYELNEIIKNVIFKGGNARFHTIQYLQETKQKIRALIKEIMPGYVFDNAFHCGQTISENIFLQELYEKNIKRNR